MRICKKLFQITLLLLVGLWLPVQVYGQSSLVVAVNEQTTVDNGDSLGLDVYFTLTNGDDGTMRQTPTVTILLEDETLTPAQVDKPPYYVALVMDASGSMEDLFAESRRAALALVDGAPPEVAFAVVRFDEQIDVVRPFTNDHTLVKSAINEIEVADKGTCLYDAAYTAVQSLNQIAPNIPRRAIAIFSDGRDQFVQSSNDPCSRRSYAQTQAFATAQGLPIYTVGITGDRTEPATVTLSELAENAASFSGVDADAANSPDIIIDHINSQWVAHAELHPTAGPQRGALLLNLASGEPLSPAPLQFYSERDYSMPPLPPAIDIVNFRYNTTSDAFQFDVLLTHFPTDHILHIETVDSVNNTQVSLILKPNSDNTRHIILPSDALKPNGRYTANVSVQSNNGNGFMKNERGETIVATHEFGYDPTTPFLFSIDSVVIEDEPAKLNLRQFRVEDDQPELVIALLLENGDQAAEYNGRLINLNNNEETDTFAFDITRSGNRATARIPTSFDETTYALVLNALDAEGEQIATASDRFSYTTPDGIFVRAAKALRDNPVLWLAFLLFFVMVTLLAGMIGRAVGRRQRKPATEQPAVVETVSNGQQPAVLNMLSSPDAQLTAVGRWEIERLPFLIGREACDLTIAGDHHVSRKHARITFAGDDYFIEDLGSSNGTFINATKIAAHEPLSINVERNERIRIGKTTTFVFGELTDELKTELENSNGENGSGHE